MPSHTLSSESESQPSSEAAVSALQWYKRIISPLLPPGCRFIPTCSEYGQQCFERFTVPQAVVLLIWRLLRCNPLHFPGTGFGIDEPVWPPCAYWAGNGQLRTFVDDEMSRKRALGELDFQTAVTAVSDNPFCMLNYGLSFGEVDRVCAAPPLCISGDDPRRVDAVLALEVLHIQ